MLSGASPSADLPVDRMRLFKCQVCAQLLYFENTRCEKCGHTLGYEPLQNQLLALDPRDQLWSVAGKTGKAYKFCANAAHGACNWLIDAASPDNFCLACRHNGIIPDLSQPQNLANWQKIEIAKHRLIYTLRRLNLPLQTRAENPEGLIFNFLADSPVDPNARVMTGHDSGTITLALAEADDVERERRRSQMGEPYRTLLGHFRHEVGHYFWDRAGARQGRARNPSSPCSATTRATTIEALQDALRAGRAGELAGQFRQRLRDGASVGGFRRDLGALSAHRRHHRDGRRVRHQRRAGARRHRRARDDHRLQSLPHQGFSEHRSTRGCRCRSR